MRECQWLAYHKPQVYMSEFRVISVTHHKANACTTNTVFIHSCHDAGLLGWMIKASYNGVIKWDTTFACSGTAVTTSSLKITKYNADTKIEISNSMITQLHIYSIRQVLLTFVTVRNFDWYWDLELLNLECVIFSTLVLLFNTLEFL